MKWIIFSLLFVANAWSKPIVLISYFDAYNKAPFNNSERVALELGKKSYSDFELKLCPLTTVFDKSYAQLENCYKNLPRTPDLVLSLGEFNCRLKVEIMGRNLDQTFGPDNEGNERKKTPVLAGSAEALPFNYPLPQMYCALDPSVRKDLEVSNSAGTFVCNNLAYQFAHYYPEITFGFIHVPAHNCRDLSAKTKMSVESLEKMIGAALKVTDQQTLPIKKSELKILREETKNDRCLNEFYKRAKGIDEKGSWPF